MIDSNFAWIWILKRVKFSQTVFMFANFFFRTEESRSSKNRIVFKFRFRDSVFMRNNGIIDSASVHKKPQNINIENLPYRYFSSIKSNKWLSERKNVVKIPLWNEFPLNINDGCNRLNTFSGWQNIHSMPPIMKLRSSNHNTKFRNWTENGTKNARSAQNWLIAKDPWKEHVFFTPIWKITI